MRNSLLSMKRAMSPIMMYNTQSQSAIMSDLAACAVFFDELSAMADSVIRECCVVTALNEGLSTYERIVGPVRTDLTAAQRRQRITALITAGENDFTLQAIRQFFSSLGFECTILERPDFFELYIIPQPREYPRAEQDFIYAVAQSFLPAHLNYAIEFRTAVWDDYDGLMLTFDEWDGLNMTWDELDRYEGEL